jgi:hypothetical protein
MKKFNNLKSFFLSKIKESSNAFVISVFLIFIFIMSATALAVWMNWKSSARQNDANSKDYLKNYLVTTTEGVCESCLEKPKEEMEFKKIAPKIGINQKEKTDEEKTIFNIVPTVFLDGWERSENFVYKEECQKEKEFANGSLGYCDVKSSVNSIFISWEKENQENMERKFMDDRILVNVFEFQDKTYAFPKNIAESYYLFPKLRELYTITFQDKIIQRYEMLKMYKLKESDSEIIKEEYYLDAFSLDKFVFTLFYDKKYQDQADDIIREIILRNIDDIKNK